MKKSAFTMLELIFVIVVIGILSAVFIPRFGQNNLSQAANQLISHIRYTQHLALMDDEYNASNPNWYYNRWSIDICAPQYKVSRFNNTTFARDPQTKKDMNGTGNYDLNQKYGVSTITVINSTIPNNRCKIAFDHLGRPYGFVAGTTTAVSPTSNLEHADINISITSGTDTVKIIIAPETGYVHLL